MKLVHAACLACTEYGLKHLMHFCIKRPTGKQPCMHSAFSNGEKEEAAPNNKQTSEIILPLCNEIEPISMRWHSFPFRWWEEDEIGCLLYIQQCQSPWYGRQHMGRYNVDDCIFFLSTAQKLLLFAWTQSTKLINITFRARRLCLSEYVLLFVCLSRCVQGLLTHIWVNIKFGM